jgi:NAD(P)-dependent dehydrogenase (short-subunit alcohol dehydrogenase family)
MTARLSGRHVLITGAGSGIGRATAELFAAEGAHVALFDRDARVAEVADAIGGRAVVADVTDETSIGHAIALAADAFGGRLDGIVNAAGIASTSKVEETSRSEWDRVIEVNLTGPFLVCKAALPLLRQARDATVVNVASASALLPSGAAAAYAASKAGLLLLTKTIAAE